MATSGFAVIDTETTGFGARDRVIEIGVVVLDDDLAPVDVWDTLLNPGRGVGPTHVHHIRADDVASAPTFNQAAGALIERLAGRVVVGHNVSFDRRMLNHEFQRLGHGAPLGDEFSLDTLRLARQLGLSPTNCYTLDFLCSVYRIDRAGAHSALYDALATASLFALAARRLGGGSQAPSSPWGHHHAAAGQAVWPVIADRGFRPLSRTR